MDILHVDSDRSRAEAIRRGADALSRGGLVVFPTETVYGVAARADHAAAVQRLRELKSRDAQKAFTVHVGSPADADRFVVAMPAIAKRLIRKAWPGPLTIITPVQNPKDTPVMAEIDPSAAEALYYGGTVGLRCPDDPIASAILRAVPHPIVAASANLAGKEPPVTGDDARREMEDGVDVLIDAGRTEYAKSSTIVRIDGSRLEVLREGGYDTRTVRRLAALRILFVCSGNTCRSPMAEGLAKKILAERLGWSPADLHDRGVFVSSAGTSGGFGRAADHAVTVMAQRDIDIAGHSSSALTADMIQQSDHVYVMTGAHRDAVLRIYPRAASHVQLLLNQEDIKDPIGGSLEEYESCAKTIEEGLRVRLQEIEL